MRARLRNGRWQMSSGRAGFCRDAEKPVKFCGGRRRSLDASLVAPTDHRRRCPKSTVGTIAGFLDSRRRSLIYETAQDGAVRLRFSAAMASMPILEGAPRCAFRSGRKSSSRRTVIVGVPRCAPSRSRRHLKFSIGSFRADAILLITS